MKIGQPLRRAEDVRFLSGKGLYVDDIVCPNALFCVLVRSPYPHATIIKIEKATAANVPGVLAVFTHDDLDNDGVGLIQPSATLSGRNGKTCYVPPRRLLAKDKVVHIGEAVAMVVAETLEKALDAAEIVKVDYLELPANTETELALKEKTPRIWSDAPSNLCLDWETGNAAAVDAAFANAAHVTEICGLVNNRIAATSIEGRAALGQFDRSSQKYTLYVTCPFVHNLRCQLATEVLNVPEANVRVVAPDVGGGFGMKNFAYPEYALVLWASGRLGCSIKWSESRSEAFISDDQARDHLTTGSLALDSKGSILGLRVSTIANFGAYVSGASPMLPTLANAAAATGAYDIPVAQLSVKGVFTNTVPVGSYRGVGRAEAIYLIERLVDKAAYEMNIDTAEMRRRNIIPAISMPYKNAFEFIVESGDFSRNLETALTNSDYIGFPERVAASRAQGKLRGIGISYYIDNSLGPGEEGADIIFEEDSSITILVGTFNNGQGLETTFRQIVSDHLGIPMEQIKFLQGDTELLPIGGGHGGSRSTEMGGSALKMAGDEVIRKGRLLAGHILEANISDIEFEDGKFKILGTDRYITLFEAANIGRDKLRRPQGLKGNLDTHARYKRKASAWPNGCHVAEVEVDPETGVTKVLRYTIVDDFGAIINPLVVSGMVQGGVAQGAGQALLEEIVYNSHDGQLATGSFMDYAVPRASDMCTLSMEFHEVPCESNLLGVKGCGEAGTIGAHPAIMNAVINALSEFGVTGLNCPATPQKVWRAIQSCL